MKKQETISEKIKKKFSLTSIAKKYDTDLAYVSTIGRKRSSIHFIHYHFRVLEES